MDAFTGRSDRLVEALPRREVRPRIIIIIFWGGELPGSWGAGGPTLAEFRVMVALSSSTPGKAFSIATMKTSFSVTKYDMALAGSTGVIKA